MKSKSLFVTLLCLVSVFYLIFLSSRNVITKISTNSQLAQVSGAGSGLLGWWTFDDGTASDGSGNGNNGTLQGGPTATTGRISQGLNFDGSDDRVSLSPFNHDIGTGDFTWSAWVYPRRVSANYDGVMSVGSYFLQT